MFYHASPVGGIKVLEPKVSNHGIPLIYFSTKRENVLVYLSNAIEKYCKETGFSHTGKWHKWASYGFEKDGILRIDEYYPNAIEETYKGVSAYIYSADVICKNDAGININNAVTTSKPVNVTGVEFINDAYTEIMKAAQSGLIRICKFEDMSADMSAWIENTIKGEYVAAETEPDYRYFLEAKFDFIKG